jgi:hypothetical protein
MKLLPYMLGALLGWALLGFGLVQACGGRLPPPANPAACAAAIGVEAAAAAEVSSASLALAECRRKHAGDCLAESERVATAGARLIGASAQVAVACAPERFDQADQSAGGDGGSK